ncbi:hypothetical protein NKH16_27080 [Mesorhizobium sp. M1307]|uniref:hypothetical protein n=1 Tax=unclassified Mesorhizobium TaxID=325217 RepID=UPI0033376A26
MFSDFYVEVSPLHDAGGKPLFSPAPAAIISSVSSPNRKQTGQTMTCVLPQVSTVPEPVTLDRIDRALDTLALAIHKAGNKGRAYLPIYERLEREKKKLIAEMGAMLRVQERLKRSRDRKAKQFF